MTWHGSLELDELVCHYGPMIPEQALKALHYVQQATECLLASYGVAAYPFTHEPVENYFDDYCRKYHIRTLNPVLAHLRHYPREQSRRGMNGYQFIGFLHRTRERSFSCCRRKFTLTLIQDVSTRIAELDNELKSTALNALMVTLNDQGHSLAVFGTNHGLIWYDTRPNTGLAGPFPSLSNMRHTLGNGLLLREFR